MGYRKDVIKGFSWIGGIRIATRVLVFIKTPIIARVLTPSQVGLFSLGAIVLAFAETITETGINIFLVQKKDNIDKYISTAWIVSIIRGLIISLIIFLSAGWIVSFFSFNDALIIVQLISLVPLIRGFINPSVGKFLKDLQFHKEFAYRTSIICMETLFSIIFVVQYQTPLGLVWAMIIGALFEVFISYAMARPLPNMNFKREFFEEILSRGKWFTLTGVFSYLYQNLDDIVIGKLMGSGALGLYDYTYKISMLPITEAVDVINKTSFPVFVKISGDKARLLKGYIKTVLISLLVSLPLGLVFYIFPEQIIALLLGSQWVGGGDVLRVLAILGVIRALSISVSSPFYALEKQEYMTVITIIGFFGLAITIVPFVQIWGIVGAGYSALFGSLFSTPFVIYYLKKVFNSSNN